MADFNTHIFSAAAVASLAATACIKVLSLSVTDGLMLTVAGVVGGILPDIDLKHSQPSRALFTVLGMVAGLIWLFAHLQDYSAIELWLAALLVFGIIRYPVWWLFHSMATHRGVLHSVIAALMAGVCSSAIAWQWLGATALHSWMLGAFLASGYLLHLTLDEIYSVDFTGVRIKRSFGTALKLIDRNQLALSILLVFITLLAWFFTAPLDQVMNQWQQSVNLPAVWQDAIIPQWLRIAP